MEREIRPRWRAGGRLRRTILTDLGLSERVLSVSDPRRLGIRIEQQYRPEIRL